MSQENVEVVRRLYELQFTPEFFEILDPNVVWINYASAPETRPYVGHEGVSEGPKAFSATSAISALTRSSSSMREGARSSPSTG